MVAKGKKERKKIIIKKTNKIRKIKIKFTMHPPPPPRKKTIENNYKKTNTQINKKCRESFLFGNNALTLGFGPIHFRLGWMEE